LSKLNPVVYEKVKKTLCNCEERQSSGYWMLPKILDAFSSQQRLTIVDVGAFQIPSALGATKAIYIAGVCLIPPDSHRGLSGAFGRKL
jgi:hypothetical protein